MGEGRGGGRERGRERGRKERRNREREGVRRERGIVGVGVGGNERGRRKGEGEEDREGRKKRRRGEMGLGKLRRNHWSCIGRKQNQQVKHLISFTVCKTDEVQYKL